MLTYVYNSKAIPSVKMMSICQPQKFPCVPSCTFPPTPPPLLVAFLSLLHSTSQAATDLLSVVPDEFVFS